MGKISNYTMGYHAYTIDRIGTAPVEFPANASGKWGGLFGTVFRGEYQLSITFWNNRYKEKPDCIILFECLLYKY